MRKLAALGFRRKSILATNVPFQSTPQTRSGLKNILSHLAIIWTSKLATLSPPYGIRDLWLPIFLLFFWMEDLLAGIFRPVLCPHCKSPDTWLASGTHVFKCHCCGLEFPKGMNWFRNFKWKRWNRAVRSLSHCWRCNQPFENKCNRCGTSMCNQCDRGYQGKCTKQEMCP